jgi:hypothetical protein
VRAVLTLTNDLHLPVSVAHTLSITIYDFGSDADGVLRCSTHTAAWTPGMVALKFEAAVEWEIGGDADMVVVAREEGSARDVDMGGVEDERGLEVIQGHRAFLGEDVPKVLGLRASFESEDAGWYMRLMDLGGGAEVEVAEEVGESICGHIW